jgi:GTP-binding protein
MGKKMHGRSAPPKIVKLPVGTIVWRTDDVEDTQPAQATPVILSGAEGSREVGLKVPPGDSSTSPGITCEPVVDLIRDGQDFVLCRGGAGGKGNVHFKSARNRAPRQYTEGEEGEQGHFLLELRTIADAGLVGYPNAGKSTLLGKISAAQPKVAVYPFTTLHPIVGVVEFPDYRRATIADIPGLIEGAHHGLGLGHEFLRHITRCRILLFVVDVAGSEGRNPIEDLRTLRREVDLHDSTLSKRPWYIIANKIDLPGASANLEALRNQFRTINVIDISAKTGEGIDRLKRELQIWVGETASPVVDRER